VNDQTLDIGDIRQQREYLEMIDKRERLLLTALDLKRKDRACSIGEITLVEVVVGV
jgi:hypothetical protein